MRDAKSRAGSRNFDDQASVCSYSFFFFFSYELRAVIRIVARYHRDAFVSLSLLVAPRRVNVADNRWSIASALCHFPCYPVAVLNIEVNCLLLPGVRMTRVFIYISIDTREIRLASIHDPLILHNSAPSAYLPSFSLYLLSVSLSQFLHRANICECVTRHARRFEKCEKNRAGVEERAFQRGKIKRERRSFTREVISRVHLSFSLYLFSAVFYRFVWDSISLTCRIARRSEYEHSRSFVCVALFHDFLYLFLSVSFSLSWKRTCL